MQRNSVGRNRTSRPLSAETLEDLAPMPPSFDGRWTQTTIYSRASHTISISGPTHFPFLESRAAHFPDVPPVPAVKCQYGTYPRTKASLVRQHHRAKLLPPRVFPILNHHARAKAFKPLWEMTHRGSCRGILRPYIHDVCLREHFNVVYGDGCVSRQCREECATDVACEFI